MANVFEYQNYQKNIYLALIISIFFGSFNFYQNLNLKINNFENN